MKTIFEGNIIITTIEEDDKRIAANLIYETSINTSTMITSNLTNREYAAVAEVMNKFKDMIVKEVSKK